MRKPKISTYSQKSSGAKIADFAKEKATRSYRLERGISEGRPWMNIIVPFKELPKGEKSIDISQFFDCPNLAVPFAEVLLNDFKKNSAPYVTAAGECRHLRNGFITFANSISTDITIEDIDTSLMERFIAWLSRTENGTSKYKKTSKEHFWNIARFVLETLQTSRDFGNRFSADLHLKKAVFGGEPTDRKRVEIIHSDDYRLIYQACKKEIEASMSQVTRLRSLMDEKMSHPIALLPDTFPAYAYTAGGGAIQKIWAQNPYFDLGLCLATLKHRTPNVILSITELARMKDKMLLNVIEQRKWFGSIPVLHTCYYPYARELVPFIIMMAIHLDYNPETLLTSKVADYRIRSNELGSLELSILDFAEESSEFEGDTENEPDDFIAASRKARSKSRRQEQIRPVTDDADNPATIWKFLVEWTAFIRPLARASIRDRLFLYVTEQANRTVQGFVGTSTAGSSGTLRNAMRRFFMDHGIPMTALGRFRPTGLDITDVLFSGDIRAKQAAGNHLNSDTTYRSYTTNAQEQRGDEKLAQIAGVRQRWFETHGKADPRNQPVDSDIGAATPGWVCADPYSGPFTSGKLCSSYGQCPNCPHGSIDLADPYCCAQAWNLLDAVNEAANAVAPQSWLTRWAPVKSKLLQSWLPSFSSEVQEKAKLINLRKLPPLE
jgi:hypothetical protein